MRLRKKKWAKPLLESQTSYVISDFSAIKGNWNKEFNNDNPIYLEIGMGKGDFIVGLATKNPSINYVGIELSETVAAIALKKVMEHELSNVRVINKDAINLEDIFTSGEIGRIYLNFSDPWPKNRHEKKRLTYKTFLEKYERLLDGKGMVCFKTDNRGLFDFSLESFEENGWKLNNVSFDYPLTDNENDVPTEYERRFRGLGNPIHRLEANK